MKFSLQETNKYLEFRYFYETVGVFCLIIISFDNYWLKVCPKIDQYVFFRC